MDGTGPHRTVFTQGVAVAHTKPRRGGWHPPSTKQQNDNPVGQPRVVAQTNHHHIRHLAPAVRPYGPLIQNPVNLPPKAAGVWSGHAP